MRRSGFCSTTIQREQNKKISGKTSLRHDRLSEEEKTSKEAEEKEEKERNTNKEEE